MVAKIGNTLLTLGINVHDDLFKVFDATPVPMVISGVDGQFEYVNPALLSLLGYSIEEIFQPEVIISHPESSTANKELREKLKKDPFSPITIEKRYLHKSGRVIEGLLTIVAQPDEQGCVKRFISQVVDQTEHKRQRDSMLLASLVYKNSSEAMMITDAKNRIVDVNPAFTSITGYTLEDVEGKPPSVLSSGQHNAEFYQAMRAEIEATGSWKGEIWNKRKNGKVYPQLLAINTVYHDDGSVFRRVALCSDVTNQKEAEALILQQANYDALTGLPNRRLFLKKLALILKQTSQTLSSGALLFLDIDRFKEVNDTLGHECGDELLKQVSQRLSQAVGDKGFVARFSGDEFTIVLENVDSHSEVSETAQRLLNAVAPPHKLAENTLYATVSIGVALFPEDSSEQGALLRYADQAMYVAKAEGRNRFQYYTESMQVEALERMSLINDLRLAIEKQQFELYYQPIIDLASGAVTKAEALIRWHHPVLGFVGPDRFIGLAEEIGMIGELGEWVFNTAANQLSQWFHSGMLVPQVSINVSPIQLDLDGISPEKWQARLQQLNLPKRAMTIEITENVLMQSSKDCWKKLTELNKNGFQVSIDDFGTGYSSLAYLKEFKADYLKIDQSFVRNLFENSDNTVLCEAIIMMAKKLGLKVIAEGIETPAQLAILQAAGCEYGQGWLFAKAMPADEIHQFVCDKTWQLDDQYII